MNQKFYLKKLCVTLLAVFSLSVLFAQDGYITGTVYEGDTHSPLAGSTVIVKGTTVGALTDAGGKYRIRAKSGDVLVFKNLGYKSKEVTIGSETKIDVNLETSVTAVDEVVVTALGISREQKSLGYAVSKIDNEAFTNVVSSNWLSGLEGKVAGLNFESASSGPGGSMRVTLRGESTLSPDKNTALFVIDGVPISSDIMGAGGSSYADTDSPIDFGGGAGDLNPDDIESVSVLKGPAATALYGARAGNGAIVITTKSGRKTKGIGVTVNSAVTFEKAGFWPDFQNEYGAGNGGAAHAPDANGTDARRYYGFWSVPATESWNGELNRRKQSRYAFGPRYEGQLFYTYDSYDWDTGIYTRLPWEAVDWYKGFFDTGITYTNSISVDGNTGKGTSIRVSAKDTRMDWIVPNTGYTSQTFNLALNSDLNKYISVNARVSYYRKDSDNLPTTGYSQASPLYALLWNVTSVPITSYKEEYMSGRLNALHEEAAAQLTTADRDRVYQKMITNGGTGSENPYRLAYENLNALDRDRVYGNLSVTAKILPKLSLTVRSGVDFSSDLTTSQKPYYSYKSEYGFYREQTARRFEMNNDFLINYNDEFFDGDLTLSANFGGNNMVSNYDRMRVVADKLTTPGIYNLANSQDPHSVDSYHSKESVNSLYGIVSLGWKDTYYLDITGRNDWFSTLRRGRNSIFYPSVSASILLDQALNLREKANWIDMIKLRISWANVGNGTDPYSLYPMYSNTAFPGSVLLPNELPNKNLKPENTEAWEAGLEVRLFNNRWSFDVAVYNNETTNQIIPVPVDHITGYSSTIINSGLVRNRGIELATTIQAIKTPSFQWTINANWSMNRNKLVRLAPGVDLWQMNSATIGDRVFIYAYPGTELGRIYGYGFQRAPKGAFYLDENGKRIDCSGQVVVNQATGNPEVMKNDASDLKDLGSIYPDWTAGMSQNFRWKNLSLNLTFTGQWGGNAYSVTHFALAYQGKLKNSLPGRFGGLVHPGVNQNSDGTYSKNTTITTDIVEYYNIHMYNRENAEMNTFKTSFLKLKELRLDYVFPQKLLRKTKFIQGLSVAFFATNLFCWTNFPQYDPEAAALSGTSLTRGIEQGAYPMTRTYGLNIKLTF